MSDNPATPPNPMVWFYIVAILLIAGGAAMLDRAFSHYSTNLGALAIGLLMFSAAVACVAHGRLVITLERTRRDLFVAEHTINQLNRDLADIQDALTSDHPLKR